MIEEDVLNLKLLDEDQLQIFNSGMSLLQADITELATSYEAKRITPDQYADGFNEIVVKRFSELKKDLGDDIYFKVFEDECLSLLDKETFLESERKSEGGTVSQN